MKNMLQPMGTNAIITLKFNGLFTLPDRDSISYSDLDYKQNWLHSIYTVQNFSYRTESDSDSNPNCPVQKMDRNQDRIRNSDLLM